MTVIDEIAAERERQIKVEGWTAEHDDQHTDGSLAAAASCYAYPPDQSRLSWRLARVRLQPRLIEWKDAALGSKRTYGRWGSHVSWAFADAPKIRAWRQGRARGILDRWGTGFASLESPWQGWPQ